MKKILLTATFCFLIGQQIFSQCSTNVSGTFSFCGSGCNGSVIFTSSSGTPPYNLVITGGPSVQYSSSYTWTNVCPGSYHYDVTDASLSCNDTGTVVITANPLPSINISVSNWFLCTGGSALINVSGALTYSWSPAIGLSATTGSSVTASPDSTTTYTVVGTDINGCTASGSTITITVNPNPVIMMCATNASCWVCCDGSITPQVSAVPPVSYLWSNGSTAAILTNLCTGAYTLSVADVNGCMSSASAVVDTGTSMHISYADDGQNYYCSTPFTAQFSVHLCVGGFAATDTVSVYQNFGDGNDTTMFVTVASLTSPVIYNHVYQLPGVYSSVYVATLPDGSADTLISISDVIGANSCGNIDGQLYVDSNSNCIYDNGEAPLSGIPIQLLIGSSVIATAYTNSNGFYIFNVPNNNYTIQPGPQLANYGYMVSCPPSGQINIPNVPSLNNDFGITCGPGFDLIAYVSCQRFRPGFTSTIYPHMFSTSCQPVSGQVKLVLDNPLISLATTTVTPDAISGDTLIWNFSNINNQNWANFGYVTVLTSLAAPLGDTICVTFIVEPMAGDVNPVNNIAVGCREISNAVDPNEKDVNPHGTIMSDDWLTYTIFFQNTGNDTAYNVFIMDTLDLNLNMNTFQPLASSHAYQTYIEGSNVVKFAFDNIMLADSNINEPFSHGWIAYRIKSLTGLPNATTIKNTAYIYFDFNAAVITNTTLTAIDNGVSIEEENFETIPISVFPNPITNQLTISSKHSAINNILIYDVLGQKILSQHIPNNKQIAVVDVSELNPGIYFLQVSAGQQNHSVKIIK